MDALIKILSVDKIDNSVVVYIKDNNDVKYKGVFKKGDYVWYEYWLNNDNRVTYEQFMKIKNLYKDNFIIDENISFSNGLLTFQRFATQYKFVVCEKEDYEKLQPDSFALAIFSNERIPKYVKMDILELKYPRFKSNEVFGMVK
jgi:hypothetical protein